MTQIGPRPDPCIIIFFGYLLCSVSDVRASLFLTAPDIWTWLVPTLQSIDYSRFSPCFLIILFSVAHLAIPSADHSPITILAWWRSSIGLLLLLLSSTKVTHALCFLFRRPPAIMPSFQRRHSFMTRRKILLFSALMGRLRPGAYPRQLLPSTSRLDCTLSSQ